MDIAPAVLLLEEEEREQRRSLIINRRNLREVSDPFNLPDARFIELYRLSKQSVHYLLGIVQNALPQNARVTGVDASLKLFAALRFYATGSYQRTIGQVKYKSLSLVIYN